MKHPVFVIPGAMQALQALHKSVEEVGLPKAITGLVTLRASQINGCGVCVGMHSKELRELGESDERVDSVAAWRDTPYFTDAERAALALTEAVTRLADKADPVPDDVWAAATDHFSESELAALLLAVAGINVWNRLNAATRQVAGGAW